MKKYMSILLVLLMLVALFPGCAAAEEPTVIRIGSLKGPTTMGMVKLLSDNEAGLTAVKYESTVVANATELMPLFLRGELDVLALPVNAGAVMYNKSQAGATLLAVNTLGVLYIVEKGGETITSVADLKGKTIYATGKSTTPEYALSYLLAENGLDIATDVTMEWKSEASEVVAQMATLDSAVALLPQPFVTVAQTKVEGLRVALDMTAEWANVGSTLITGGLIIRTAFLNEHPEAVKTFLEEYAASTQYVNENVEEAAALVEQYIGVAAGVAKKAIPACNIVCMTGEEMKAAAEKYLTVLFELNPDAVGGAMPGESFYYLP
ncbi:MAG: ABC transporter substrate-binding protein [Clostridia bacterium]|nr:ABC transporter substrate-binding protein [Clostridia bacterium]